MQENRSDHTPDDRPKRSFISLARAALGILILAALAAAHVHVRRQGGEFTGLLLVADHIFTVASALLMLAICAAAGRLALRRFHVDLRRPLDDLAFSTAVGAALISVSLLVIGLLSVLHPLVIGFTLLAWAVAARHHFAELPSLCLNGARYLRNHSGHRAFGIAAVTVVILVTAFMLLQAVAPPTDWDSLMYHLQVPRQFLEHGRIYVPEDSLHVAFVGLVQLLYLPLLAVQSPAAPAVVSILLALLLGLATFSAATRLFDGATAGMSLMTLWATTMVLLVAITPRVDVTLALYLFLAHYALLIALSDPAERAHLYVAAALLGCTVGVKYHSLVYGLALAPLILWTARSRSTSLKDMTKGVALFGLLFVLAAAPWLIKNLILFKAPLYPFFSDLTLPPWIAAIYGTSGIPESVDRAAFHAIDHARSSFNLVHLFTAPGLLTVEQEGTYYFMNFLYLLLPLCLLFYKDKWLGWLVVPSVAYLVMALVPFPTTNLRYLMPAIPPLTLAVASITVRAANKLFSAGAARLLLICTALLALYPSAKAMTLWLRKSDVLGYASGTTSQRQYLETGYYFLSQLIQSTETWVPEDGKLLLLFEARGFYLKPQVIQDPLLANWPLLAPKVGDGYYCLESTGITHILVNDVAVRYYVSRGSDPSALRLDLFADFGSRCLIPLYRGQGFGILGLRSEGTGGSSAPPSE